MPVMGEKISVISVGPLESNCYCVVRDGRAVIIDCGEDITWFIQKEVIGQGAEIVAALYTHGHIDHLSGMPALKIAAPDIPHLLHHDDRPLIDALPDQAEYLGLPCPAVSTKDFTYFTSLEDIDGLAFISSMHTPGHSPGSVTYIFNDKLFTGDLIFRESVGRSDILGGSSAALFTSIRSVILTLPDPTLIYPGHGPATTVGYERLNNPFL